jgi:hypothetical protein
MKILFIMKLKNLGIMLENIIYWIMDQRRILRFLVVKLLHEISNYVASTKVAKWTETELQKLDEWLKHNTKVKAIAGVGVAALLAYIWFNCAFSGHTSVDFDMSDMLSALVGKFALHQLFAGPNGVRMLLLFVGGALGLTFPWPGAQSVQFIASMFLTLYKAAKHKLKTVSIKQLI